MVLLLLVQARGVTGSERPRLLVRGRGERAGHFEIAARLGAARVDKDASGGQRRLEALEAVREERREP